MPKRLTTDEFIKKAIEIHGDKYDYSKVNYVNSVTKVKIICNIHEEFGQKPQHHLSANGCPKCGVLTTNQKNSRTTDEFIKKAIEIHGDKYDYSKVNYVSAHKKVIIICKVHGEFSQRPMGHSRGIGCPKCAAGGFNPDKKATLYYLYDPQEDLYKIGITNKDAGSRFGAGFLRDRKVEILMEESYSSGEQALLAEQEILQAFVDYRTLNPTWPEALGGKTEFFNRNILEL